MTLKTFLTKNTSKNNFISEIFLNIYSFLTSLIEKIIYRKKFLLNDKEENLFSKKEIYIKIILACAFSLFLELAIIRIHSSFLHYFSFLKNVSLISCFLGLGIGYSLKRYKVFSLNWIFPLLFLQLVMIYSAKLHP